MDYCIAFWNVENLFDQQNSPRRTDKLQRTIGNELRGWTKPVLNRKISQLASVIRSMNNGAGPDLFGVCEIENRHVLKLLVSALGPLPRKYGIAHDDTSDKRGIDVALIYDTRHFNAEKQFSHYIVKRTATRDLFQVNFLTKPGNRPFIVVGNHWPARSAGQYESEPYRIIAGETLAYFHERIRKIQGNDAAVLAMGDFNDEPHDRSLTDYALAERTRSRVTRARSAKWLNLMWPISGQGIGTHYYNNSPNVLDQFLASKGLVTGKSGLRVDPDSVDVFRFPAMVAKGAYPAPIRFGRKNHINRDGFSDHFPITLTIRG